MGKEIINPRHNDVGKKILSVGRAGLLSIAVIGAGLGAIDCAKKPSSSQSPAGIGENSPQFPQGNDRPLQSQPAKPEVLREKWQAFKSSILPYEIQYPTSWEKTGASTGQYTEEYFRDRDYFRSGLNLAITGHIDSNSTLDNYINNYIKGYRDNWRSEVVFTTKKRLVANLPAQILEITIPPSMHSENDTFTSTFFAEPQPDGSKRLWLISYGYQRTVSKTDRESLLNRFLDSFKITQDSSLKNQSAKKEAQKPAQKEQSGNIETQAKTVVLNWALKILSSNQQYRDRSDVSINSSIINGSQSFPLNEIINGKSVSKDSDLLKTKWMRTESADRKNRKSTGEVEIKNFKFMGISLVPASGADKENGIEWRGSSSLQFIERYRTAMIYLKYSANSWSSDFVYDSDWPKGDIPYPTGPFSPWEDGSLGTELIKKNGVWQVKGTWIPYYESRYPAPVLTDDPNRNPRPGIEAKFIITGPK